MNTYIHTYKHICPLISIYKYIAVYTHILTYKLSDIYAYIYLYTYIYVYIFTCICVNIYISIFIHLYICISLIVCVYIYIHTHTLILKLIQGLSEKKQDLVCHVSVGLKKHNNIIISSNMIFMEGCGQDTILHIHFVGLRMFKEECKVVKMKSKCRTLSTCKNEVNVDCVRYEVCDDPLLSVWRKLKYFVCDTSPITFFISRLPLRQ